jgi:hypothetical protein
MRNALLMGALLSGAAGLAAAQTFTVPAQGVPAQAPAGPWAQKLFYGVSTHDFGTVPHGAQLKHRFKMHNPYQVPLHLDIRSSCGCLTFTPSTRDLGPEAEGYIDINMDARRFKGPKQVTLYVTVGPQYVSTASILVTANARADVVFNPGQVDFGIVRQGQSFTQAIDVEYAGGLDWRVLQVVKNADAPFTVEPQELYRRRAGTFSRTTTVGYRLAITLKPTAPAGPFREELLLKTNDPISPMLTVPVEGNVQAALSVAPGVVRLGTVKVGVSKTQRVQVRGSRPFRILGVDGGGGAVTADLPAAQATSHILTLQCRPDRPGEWRRQLTIRTDLDDGATAAVTVEATVEP